MSEHECISLKKEWDYTPDTVNMENKNAHIQDTRAYQLLVDLLQRGTKGAFLLSGKRGVGKTTQVVHAIEKVKELEKRADRKTLVVSVDASNFEIFAKDKQDVQSAAEIDLLKTKYSILQNLCLELTKKIRQSLDSELMNVKKVDRTTKKYNVFSKFALRERDNTKGLDFTDKVLSTPEEDLLEKTLDLMNKAKAKKMNTETSLQSLLQDKLNISSESTISLQTATKLSLASIPFITTGIAWSTLSLRPTGITIWDSILPVAVASIPPVAIAISGNIKKIKTINKEKEQKTSTNLSYEYDANAMQEDLERVLSILTANNYKVIFVIDNLGQVNQDFMASLIGIRRLLSFTKFVYFISSEMKDIIHI